MAKHKISISFDKLNFIWIVEINGSIVRNPTEEDFKDAELKKYSETNICPICREDYEKNGIELTDRSILYPGNAFPGIDKDSKKIGRLCKRHYGRNYQRYDPNSQCNIRKSIADRRTGNLDVDYVLGDNCEELTSGWLCAKRLSVEYDKYSMLPYDHSHIPNGISVMIGKKLVDLSDKVPQTKGRTYDQTEHFWSTHCNNEHDKEFDILVFYCVSIDGNVIERVYIFPKDEITKIGTITIYENTFGYRGWGWYEKYRVINEEELKKINKIWQKITKK